MSVDLIIEIDPINQTSWQFLQSMKMSIESLEIEMENELCQFVISYTKQYFLYLFNAISTYLDELMYYNFDNYNQKSVKKSPEVWFTPHLALNDSMMWNLTMPRMPIIDH